MYDTVIQSQFLGNTPLQHFPAERFPSIHPVHWLNSHFAVGGWSPLGRLSEMLTAHMTRIAPHSGFTWHPHRGLEIYTWVLEGQLYHEDTTGGRGWIGSGELQRMFSGDWIEHQELNRTGDPVRVIQIWYAAGLEHRGLAPHYQQVDQAGLQARRHGDATVRTLIGPSSPMEQHMRGRLTATPIDPSGRTWLEPPGPGEDLFLYVTDGAGILERWRQTTGQSIPSKGSPGETDLGQYDVILASPRAPAAALRAQSEGLHFLSFYLPSFLPG